MTDPKHSVELKKKLQRLNELATIINLHEKQLLITEQKAAISGLEAKMEFRLDTLVLESKLKEAEIKIEIFEQIVNVLNTKHV